MRLTYTLEKLLVIRATNEATDCYSGREVATGLQVQRAEAVISEWRKYLTNDAETYEIIKMWNDATGRCVATIKGE